MDINSPIEQLVEQAVVTMEHFDYTPQTVKKFRKGCQAFLEYVHRRNYTGEFTEALGEDFLRDVYGFPGETADEENSQQINYAILCIRRLGEVKLHGVFSINRSRKYVDKSEWYGDDLECFNTYIESLKKTDITLNTQKSKRRHVQSFYCYLFSKEVHGLHETTPKIFSEFAATRQGFSSSYVRDRLSTLRGYLRFACQNNFCEKDWSDYVPISSAPLNPKLPSLWTESEVEKLITGIDRNSPVGKRDYAMILLALQQGLRSSDIAGLCLTNLKWERKEIEFVQQKTGKRVTHPILPEVGWAIIDYIRYARPQSDAPYVFLSCQKPIGKLDHSAIATMLDRHMRKSGIEKPTETIKGMHSLRHTLARRLMENGTTLPMVAEIMGHSSYVSTSPYLRIDIEGMRDCALSLSEVGYHG